MKIHRINEFSMLGWRFTHKSKLLPKSIANYYYDAYGVGPCMINPFEVISYYARKFVNRLFPNYLIETKTQHRSRTHWVGYDTNAMMSFFEKVKKNKIEGVSLSKEEIKKIYSFTDSDEQIAYLRKLYDEGRLGKPLKDNQRYA